MNRKTAEPGAPALLALYQRLLAEHGPQHWWPAESPFEMIVGAYLTQNTSWRNVELALINLRASNKLSIAGIRDTPLSELEQLLRPSGFFRQKASRLKAFVSMLEAEHATDLAMFLALPTDALRNRLLALPGVGLETADSILLYAARRPIFVVDLYTRRLLQAESIYPDALTVDYETLRLRIESALSLFYPDPAVRTYVFNEFHALIVAEGKQFRSSRIRA